MPGRIRSGEHRGRSSRRAERDKQGSLPALGRHGHTAQNLDDTRGRTACCEGTKYMPTRRSGRSRKAILTPALDPYSSHGSKNRASRSFAPPSGRLLPTAGGTPCSLRPLRKVWAGRLYIRDKRCISLRPAGTGRPCFLELGSTSGSEVHGSRCSRSALRWISLSGRHGRLRRSHPRHQCGSLHTARHGRNPRGFC